jgi:hypothetical protein
MAPAEAVVVRNKPLRTLFMEYKEKKTREWEEAQRRWEWEEAYGGQQVDGVFWELV